jgi:hypothetical protein
MYDERETRAGNTRRLLKVVSAASALAAGLGSPAVILMGDAIGEAAGHGDPVNLPCSGY